MPSEEDLQNSRESEVGVLVRLTETPPKRKGLEHGVGRTVKTRSGQRGTTDTSTTSVEEQEPKGSKPTLGGGGEHSEKNTGGVAAFQGEPVAKNVTWGAAVRIAPWGERGEGVETLSQTNKGRRGLNPRKKFPSNQGGQKSHPGQTPKHNAQHT